MGQQIARVRVALSGWTGGPGLATFYYRPEVEDEVPLLAMCQAVADGVHDAWLGLLTFFPAFLNIQVNSPVDVIDSETGLLTASFGITPPSAVVGSAGALSGPQASMLCINYLTDTIINGHRVRGRTFVGPLKAGGDADGTPTSAQLVQMDEFGDDLEVTPNHQVIWHRPVNGAGGAAADVTAHVTADRFAVLTSRRG